MRSATISWLSAGLSSGDEKAEFGDGVEEVLGLGDYPATR